MKPIQVSKRALRRFLLEKQLLLDPRKMSENDGADERQRVMKVIRQLECVQIDPVAAVRPNQHLVLAARIPGYKPAMLNELLRGQEVFEYFANAACAIPMADYPIFEPTRIRMREHTSAAIEQLRTVVEQVMDKLRAEGPLPAKAFESDERVHGYWDNVQAKTKATSHALNLLMDAAQIRIVGREGNQRLFDVTERSVPSELLALAGKISEDEARRAMLLKYMRAYRVFEPSNAGFGWQRLKAADRRSVIGQGMDAGWISSLEIEDLDQPYYILSSDAECLMAHQQLIGDLGEQFDEDAPISFLPPLDNLVWSRKRLEDLFGFEYRWEIYTPAVKRKYGYYAMPILIGDRLIGRMDPRLDDKEKHLKVELLQIDSGVDVSDRLRANIREAIASFGRTHGAASVSIASWVEADELRGSIKREILA